MSREHPEGQSTPVVFSSDVLTVTLGSVGLAIVEAYLKQSDITVIAAVRDPSSAVALQAIKPTGSNKLVIVQIRSGPNDDAKKAAQELQQKYNITAVDVVIANAAIRSGPEAKVGDVDFDILREHFEVK